MFQDQFRLPMVADGFGAPPPSEQTSEQPYTARPELGSSCAAAEPTHTSSNATSVAVKTAAEAPHGVCHTRSALSRTKCSVFMLPAT